MDNGQLPPIQSVQSMPPVQSAQVMPNGMPMVQRVQVMPEKKKDVVGLVKTIVIIVVSLIAVTFIGLFIWMFVQYNDVKENAEDEKAKAVALAKDEQWNKDQEVFAETEKNPYKVFAGPVDYGQLSFLYPKTWSVYIAADALNGGDFKAYLNPGQVDPVSDTTINALRVTIRNKSFEDVVEEYQRATDRKDSNLTVESVTIGSEENGGPITANRYTGTIPNTDLSGYIVIFKIRDKTVILQTDSVLFQADFDKLLETVSFNA